MSLTDKLAAERRARLAAERRLDLKSRELSQANRKLSDHALSLSGQIVQSRERAEQALGRQRQTEEALHRVEAQVEIVERRLWDSVETITDGFAVFDAEDRLVAANSAWLALFGLSPRIGPGTSYLEVLTVAVEDGIVDLAGGDPGAWVGDMLHRWDAPLAAEITLRLTEGTWIRMLDRRTRDGDMVCLAQNITAMKQREVELKEARARAEAANRAKSAFLANMSHELRTPMNGVVAMAEMLLEGDLDEEQRLYLQTIRNSGESLLRIINDVLDFSKIEAERLVLRPEPFDLERLIHEVLTLVAPTARDKAIGLHVDYDLFLPTLLVGDPGRIRQVLTNLVGNAVKFTGEGHVLIRVVGLEHEDGTWRLHITVEDTGIGIEPEMQEHIFGSFAQVEDARDRRYEGTGLGLAITRELVELMGGQIWVDSEKGRGACFGFQVALPSGEPRRPQPRPLEPGTARALIVGGDDLDAGILERQLAQIGLSVSRAASARAARAALAAGPAPQILLVEARLPDGDGAAFAGALRAAGLRAATVLTCDPALPLPPGCGTLAAALRGVAGGVSGVDAILPRPILRSELFRALANLPASAQPASPAPAASPPHAPGSAATVAADPATPPRQLPGQTGSQTAAGRAMRVLAAEDNSTNRLVFSKMVKALDIELAFASDGAEAVALQASFNPDLVFMDISMPGMDGKEATRRIRAAEPEGARVPIVALTAHAMTGDRDEILAAGLDDYLTKPLRKAMIVERILAHCPSACRPPLPDVAATG